MAVGCSFNNLDFSDARELLIVDTINTIIAFNYETQNPFGTKDTVFAITGDTITFTIESQDSAISYQWFRADSSMIIGATDTLFAIINVQITDSGGYYCRSYGTALQIMTVGTGIDSFQSETKIVYVIPAGGTPPTITFSQSDVSCAGGSDGTAYSSVSDGTPPYTYSWSNSATTNNIISLSAGTYTVTVTDSTNTVAFNSVVITEPAVVLAGVNKLSDASCNGGVDGVLQAVPTGGTSPYTFSWSTGETTSSISSLSSGTYFLTLTDANYCKDTSVGVTVNETNSFAITVTLTPETCLGDSDGGSSISVSGGTSPYQYYWSNNTTSSSISSIASGIYSVSITDVNLCDTVFSFQIDTLNSSSCDLVWPGDVNMDLVANQYDLFGIGLNYNDSGPSRPAQYQGNNWSGYPCLPWNDQQVNLEDKKHADCNGDGIVDYKDVTALIDNFGSVHSKRQKLNKAMGKTVEIIVIVQDDDIAPGGSINCEIDLNSDSMDVYAAAFSLGISAKQIDLETIDLDYSQSWLAVGDSSFLTFKNINTTDGNINGSCSRTDKQNNRGAGKLAGLKFQISPDAEPGSEVVIQILNAMVINNEGDTVALSYVNDTVRIVEDIYLQIKVYPNPSTGVVNFELPDSQEPYYVSIINHLGNTMYVEDDFASGFTTVNFSEFRRGVYLVNVQNVDQSQRMKLVLLSGY
ncbi:T9SS type A sorting domain-containing protein [Sphingobacteriaceae bacterium AH-315-L07]|nr:T9SS type A sorting domain-containing protein [Sphingobacteriaceae bacterium AH-315-L07]